MTSTETHAVKCNQNRIFGCGATNSLPVVLTTIGIDRVRYMASGMCGCGLPLCAVGDRDR